MTSITIVGENVPGGTYLLRLEAAKEVPVRIGRFNAGKPVLIPAGTAVYGYEYFTQTVGADFLGQPRLGVVPFQVSFTDLSWGEDLIYTWDFGDGGSSSLHSPVHTYTTTGTFTVSLAVQNSIDVHTLTRPAYIHAVDTIYPVYLPIIMKSCGGEICQGDRR